VDESTPVCPAKDDYAESKAASERVIARTAARGLPAVILRLSHVYGPFSGAYTIRPVCQLLEGVPVLVERGDMPSNTLYVDNAVEAITRALEAPECFADGRPFTISDGDDITWAEFYGHFARALGANMRAVSVEEMLRLRDQKRGRGLRYWATSWHRGFGDLMTSTELRELARRLLRTDPLGRFPRWALNTFPGLRRILEMLMGTPAPIYRGHHQDVMPLPHAPSLELLELYSCPARVSIETARRDLGYSPRVPRGRAMELTIDWVAFNRFLAQ